MISFDPSITFGAILQTLVLLGGILAWGMKLNTDISLIKADISNLQSSNKNFSATFSQLGNVLTQIAVQDTRISNIDKRITDLSHGRGFVLKEME